MNIWWLFSEGRSSFMINGSHRTDQDRLRTLPPKPLCRSFGCVKLLCGKLRGMSKGSFGSSSSASEMQELLCQVCRNVASMHDHTCQKASELGWFHNFASAVLCTGPPTAHWNDDCRLRLKIDEKNQPTNDSCRRKTCFGYSKGHTNKQKEFNQCSR